MHSYPYLVLLARPYCLFFRGGEGVRVVAPVTQLITYRSPIRDGLSGGFRFLSLFPHFPHVARFSSLVPSQSTRRFCSFRRDCECFLSPLSGSSFSSHRERRSGSVVRELVKRASVFQYAVFTFPIPGAHRAWVLYPALRRAAAVYLYTLHCFP